VKVIVAGSRSITDLSVVELAIKDSALQATEIVSGGACGVDRLGERWASNHRLPIKRFTAQWATRGYGAGYVRNREMAHYADALVAVWDGRSGGTRHMIETMQAAGKPVFVSIWNMGRRP